MAWSTPKTDWTSAEAIGAGDLNRIESNIDFIGDNPSGTLLELNPSGSAVTLGRSTDNFTGSILQITNDSFDCVTIARDSANSTRLQFRNTEGALGDVYGNQSVGGTKGLTLRNASTSFGVHVADAFLVNTTTDDSTGATLQVDGGVSLTGDLIPKDDAQTEGSWVLTTGATQVIPRGVYMVQLQVGSLGTYSILNIIMEQVGVFT